MRQCEVSGSARPGMGQADQIMVLFLVIGVEHPWSSTRQRWIVGKGFLFIPETTGPFQLLGDCIGCQAITQEEAAPAGKPLRS